MIFQNFSQGCLGRATVASALSPEESLIVFQHLNHARKSFSLCHELHLIFQLTPVFHGISPKWTDFLRIYLTLKQADKEVGFHFF
jgi:hypothetical protein